MTSDIQFNKNGGGPLIVSLMQFEKLTDIKTFPCSKKPSLARKNLSVTCIATNQLKKN